MGGEVEWTTQHQSVLLTTTVTAPSTLPAPQRANEQAICPTTQGPFLHTYVKAQLAGEGPPELRRTLGFARVHSTVSPAGSVHHRSPKMGPVGVHRAALTLP